MNLLISVGKGKFKTAHPGQVALDGGKDLPPFTTNKRVCVKQLYRERENNGGIARLDGRYELSALITECNCIRWASILLDITYQFITHEIEQRGWPKFPIPDLRYTRLMLAIVQDGSHKEKAYLVEEWIGNDKGKGKPQFRKYINNRLPTSCVPDEAPTSAHDIADFLVFSQHSQWQKTKKGAFVSDYQGGGSLLTDPQITSNPYVPTSMTSGHLTDILNYSEFGKSFGGGNLEAAFNDFRTDHVCNQYCRFFGLMLDNPLAAQSPSAEPESGLIDVE